MCKRWKHNPTFWKQRFILSGEYWYGTIIWKYIIKSIRCRNG